MWIYLSAGFLYKGKTDFASSGVCAVLSLCVVGLGSQQTNTAQSRHIWWCSYPTAPPQKKEKQHTHTKKKNIPRNHHYVTTKLALKLATHYNKSTDEENHPPISSCAAIVTILNCVSVLSAQGRPAYQLRASRKAPSATRFMPAASQQLSSYTKLWMIHQRYNVNVCICKLKKIYIYSKSKWIAPKEYRLSDSLFCANHQFLSNVHLHFIPSWTNVTRLLRTCLLQPSSGVHPTYSS